MNIQQIRILARDETTSLEKLRELVKHKDYLTRKHIAENPNTPIELLLNVLCFEHPN